MGTFAANGRAVLVGGPRPGTRQRCVGPSDACSPPVPAGSGATSGGATPDPGRAPLHVLIADDTLTNRFILENSARRCGLLPVSAQDGEEAVALFDADEEIQLVILDWMMPGLTGPEVCRHIRAQPRGRFVYVIMITARDGREDIREGLAAGADDYVVKPADLAELELRLRVGIRTVELQRELRAKIGQLEGSLAEIRRLQGLLPMCMYCKKIRDDEGYWEAVEVYIRDRSEATVSHGICPDCFEERFSAYGDPDESG